MTTAATNPGFQELLSQIDFGLMKRKLLSELHGEGWSRERVEHAEREYRRFLTLIDAHPTEDIVPNKEVDTFWHYHILDTRAYARDMQALFGEPLHHYPYFGIDDESTDVDLAQAFERTKQLYRSKFNEPMVGYANACSGSGGSCAGRCKG